MDDIPDSTDWLNTPLADLAPLDSALRCQVCKDFFTTPMITSCSHTFCSLCIRRYLSQEGRCPACREADQEMKLRRNWAVEELVVHFGLAREKVLKFAKEGVRREGEVEVESERPKKRRRVENGVLEAGVGRRSTRSQTRRTTAAGASQTSQDISVASQTSVLVSDDDEDGESVYRVSPKQPAKTNGAALEPGTVRCPCCSKPVREATINSHLDRCMAGEPTTPPASTQSSHARKAGGRSTTTTATIPPGSIAYHHTDTPATTPNPRLPTINYTLYSDTALRKKLRDLGIPATGSRETLRRRHTEWMNLWNANCDASSSSSSVAIDRRTKSKRELLRELDNWERTVGRQIERSAGNGGGGGTGNGGSAGGGQTGVMIKEFDRDRWVRENKSDFEDLIRKAREQRQKQQQKNENENRAGNENQRDSTENGDEESDRHGEDSAKQRNDDTNSNSSANANINLDTNGDIDLDSHSHSRPKTMGLLEPNEKSDVESPSLLRPQISISMSSSSHVNNINREDLRVEDEQKQQQSKSRSERESVNHDHDAIVSGDSGNNVGGENSNGTETENVKMKTRMFR